MNKIIKKPVRRKIRHFFFSFNGSHVPHGHRVVPFSYSTALNHFKLCTSEELVLNKFNK